jgi:hypothetical protein
MARLPKATLDELASLKTELLVILDEATALAAKLFQHYGETQDTLVDLNELAEVAEQIRDLYVSLSTLLLRIAEAQPGASLATMKKLTEVAQTVRSSCTKSLQSMNEVKSRWTL